MTLTIDVPVSLEQVLRDRAADRGQELQAFVLDALRQLMGQLEGPSASAPPAPAAGTANVPETSEEDGAAPWRGVFTADPPRQPLFTQEMNLRLAELPRWQPEVVITPRQTGDEDE